MSREEWNKAYLAGFLASGEGWNGEYPFSERACQKDDLWVKNRDDCFNHLHQKEAPCETTASPQ